MRKTKFAFLLAVIMLLTAIVVPAAGIAAEGDKTVTVALPKAWDSMMPLNTNSNYSRFISDQLYDRLTMATSSGEFVPRLATSWETNADSTAITFKLAENVKWSDGKPFTAEDVVFSFQLFSNPGVELLSRHYLQFIDGVDESGAELSEKSINVKADGDYTVTITMKNAMFPDTLLQSINTVFIIPKHIFDGKTVEEINAPDLWANPVGTGPFTLDTVISGERMEMKANPDYFQGKPDIDRLVVRVVDPTSLLAGLISGEIDVNAMGSIPLEDWEFAQEQENITTHSIPGTSYQTVLFNTSKPYQTERVRQALSMAINRTVLVESLLKGQGKEIVTPIPPVHPYFNESIEVVYDPDRAAEILKEENFPFDQEMMFYTPSDSLRERSVALIAQDFNKVGVKVKIQTVDFTELMKIMREGSHDFGIIGSGGNLDPGSAREMLAPGSPVNFSHLTDTALVDLIDKGNKELTFEARKPIFDEFQVKVTEMSPFAYLYATNNLVGASKRLSDVPVDNFDSLNWATWTWKVN